jgi:adenosine deaminase
VACEVDGQVMTKEKTLLVISGSSPLVVPEAYYYAENGYRKVHVLTGDGSTGRTSTDVIHEFFLGLPEVEYTVHRIKNFLKLESSREHQLFEEALYRWYRHFMPEEGLPDVCLAGGFKSMSSAMQKAAHLFGAEKVFHVLCEIPGKAFPENQPKTLSDMEEARAADGLRFIEMGYEPGLRSLQVLPRDHFGWDCEHTTISNEYELIVGETFAFREQVAGLENVLRRQTDPESLLSTLPFPSLALWMDADLAWLEQPLDFEEDRAWLEQLPKVELHCHLGGFATHGKLLEEVRAAAEGKIPEKAEPELPNDWPLPEEPCGLNTYMKLGDATGSKLLSEPGCLRRHIELLYQHFQEQRIVYAEVRCSPGNYAKDRSPMDVLQDIRKAFHDCRELAIQKGQFVIDVNLIVIVTRRLDGDLSHITRHLSLAVTAAEYEAGLSCQVVGVDLAGFEEEKTRPMYFQADFEQAHRCGLAVTVHAGENDDSESIWQAVYKLSALRIGHGLHLKDARHLVRAVAQKRIGVEMCPYANYQIKGFALDGKQGNAYPALDYLNAGIPVTINTDNPGISAASLTDNLLLLARLCPGVSRKEILRFQRNSVETAFVSPSKREELLKRMDELLRK